MKISYEQLSISSARDVVLGLSSNFALYEEITKTLKVRPHELRKLFFPLTLSSLEYSFFARDLASGQVVGAIIGNDFTFFKSFNFQEKFSPNLEYVIDFLSSLEEKFHKKNSHLIRKKIFFYQYALYVNKEYEGQGIGLKLLNLSIEKAEQNGFKNLVTIATGLVSQHLFLNKLGYMKKEEIFYKDYKVNDKIVFAYLETPSCMWLQKPIR